MGMSGAASAGQAPRGHPGCKGTRSQGSGGLGLGVSCGSKGLRGFMFTALQGRGGSRDS